MNTNDNSKPPGTDRRMFSLLVEPDLLWKWGIVAAHEKKKKKDIVLSLLIPYINQRFDDIFGNMNQNNEEDNIDNI